MYGAEWLIGLGLLGLVTGLGGGYLLATRVGAGAGRLRELEAELERARRELTDYRQEVVAQFSETARKFQTLNDSYTDLHQQLARSSSILCGDVTGPLLAAPAGHQDLLPDATRTADGDRPARRPREEPSASGGEEPSASSGEEPSAHSDEEPSASLDEEPSATTEKEDIRVSEPPGPSASEAVEPDDAAHRRQAAGRG